MPVIPGKPESETKNEHPVEAAADERPELTFANVVRDIISGIKALIVDPECNKVVIPLLLMVESLALKLIRSNVSYTEIDYTAYMEQIKIIKDGELNYARIFGGTGPLVYPAGHIWIYKFLSWITMGVENIPMGQAFFSYLYLLNSLLVFIVYYNMNLPPWVLYLVCLSKRLHSIYILRLFNDCFTTLFMVITVLILQAAASYKGTNSARARLLTNYLASYTFGLAISIKMNALLYVPGFLVVAYFINDEVLLKLLIPLAVIVSTEVFVAWDYIFNGEIIRHSYFNGAFNFRRKFLYEWSVNWKFISEEVFNNENFHQLLLVLQLVLIAFFLLTKWGSSRVTGKPLKRLIMDAFHIWKPTLSPSNIILQPSNGQRYVVGVLVSSNLIGVICSRSLHYQFLSWYCWSYPFMLYMTGVQFVVAALAGLVHEWCWNVYPATKESSFVLLSINILVLFGYWLGADHARAQIESTEVIDDDKKKK